MSSRNEDEKRAIPGVVELLASLHTACRLLQLLLIMLLPLQAWWHLCTDWSVVHSVEVASQAESFAGVWESASGLSHTCLFVSGCQLAPPSFSPVPSHSMPASMPPHCLPPSPLPPLTHTYKHRSVTHYKILFKSTGQQFPCVPLLRQIRRQQWWFWLWWCIP